MAVDLFDARLRRSVRRIARKPPCRRHVEVGDAENKRLIALVGATVEQAGGLGVGAGHDDARHPHDVELQARGVEPLNLLVLRHQNLAALMSALLHARLLVLDVIAGNPDLDEAADQVADVRVSAVAGVGVGDDERPKIDLGRRRLLLRSLRARAKCWFLSAVSRARTRAAASSGTWLSG